MTVKIELSKLQPNEGQIEGLPANPRKINEAKLEKLKKSLQDNPEMLELRELLVFFYDEKYVIIAGNMRYRAALDLGIKSLPCKIIPPETPVEKLKAYTVKDNVGFGDWDFDMLTSNWDTEQLGDWGLDDIPLYRATNEIKTINTLPYERTHVLISFPPQKLIEIQDYLKKIKENDFIEYEQTSN